LNGSPGTRAAQLYAVGRQIRKGERDATDGVRSISLIAAAEERDRCLTIIRKALPAKEAERLVGEIIRLGILQVIGLQPDPE
jgi:hypothetical protein